MYVLHYAPDNASMVIRLVLEGAGLPYRATLVDRSIRQQDSLAYRRLNPTGLIPTLETQDGPISETAAILLWLADRHGLAPRPEDRARATFLRWLFFLSNTVHADLVTMFYPSRYVPAQAISAHHDLMAGRMQGHWALLDGIVQDHPALFTPQGILAPYLCALMRWSVLYPTGQTQWFTLATYPALRHVAKAMEAAPQTARAAQAEGLGPHPFTAPALARPSEGSAT